MKSCPRLFTIVIVILLAAVKAGCAQTPPAAPPPASPAPASTNAAAPQPPNLTTPQGKVSQPAGPVDIANEPIVKIVANVQPAVVNITAEETVPEYYTAYNSYFRIFHPSRKASSIGSGLIISADGFVLTNAHVVALSEKQKEVSVTLTSGSKYQAQIITADEDADLALLKIEGQATQFPYFDLSYTSPNLLGETVIALGSPAGYQNSVSHGILSALHRTFSVENHTYNNLIQTDAAINPGNSGGPLVDLNGGLVGINSAKLAGTGIENIGFAIPNEVVIPWAHDAIDVAKGLKTAPASPVASMMDIIHQRLGLTLKTITADDAAQLNMQLNGGLLVTGVDEDSPAARAGLNENMVVVAIGNRPVSDAKSLPRELLQMKTGTKVRLQVIILQAVGPLTIQRGGSVILTAK